MAIQRDPMLELPAIEAELNFLAPMTEKPFRYNYGPPPGKPETNAVYEPKRVRINDVRPIAGRLSLDREGFALIDSPSEVTDFDDEDAIRRVYYTEAERVFMSQTGATRVVLFDHTIRRAQKQAARRPVNRVHVDQTERSGPNRVRQLLPDEADRFLQGRVRIINLWRPIKGPVLESPLAVCDAQTVARQDLVPSDLIYPDWTGETYAVTYNPEQRWFYFPHMRPQEALLLKCYDSATDGRARFTPHAAFEDPTSPPGAPPRESIELRALLVGPD
ncbi:MAG: hypothetical protein JO110_23165 [Acetobacteraceae bacterium]|nr:hypothetical protein [Acetobacteraceae bacterium]